MPADVGAASPARATAAGSGSVHEWDPFSVELAEVSVQCASFLSVPCHRVCTVGAAARAGNTRTAQVRWRGAGSAQSSGVSALMRPSLPWPGARAEEALLERVHGDFRFWHVGSFSHICTGTGQVCKSMRMNKKGFSKLLRKTEPRFDGDTSTVQAPSHTGTGRTPPTSAPRLASPCHTKQRAAHAMSHRTHLPAQHARQPHSTSTS